MVMTTAWLAYVESHGRPHPDKGAHPNLSDLQCWQVASFLGAGVAGTDPSNLYEAAAFAACGTEDIQQFVRFGRPREAWPELAPAEARDLFRRHALRRLMRPASQGDRGRA